MKRCSKCILPESYPDISFDAEGVCNYCKTYENMKYKGEKALQEMISKYGKGKGDYDCLVGISGGRDSAYALYYLVKVKKLRVLAYTADSGFVPEIAIENMKKMVDILQVDMVYEKHKFLKKTFKNNVLSWLRKPSPAMILMVCSGCRLGMFRGLLKVAKKNNVPLIFLGGGTRIEVCDFKKTLLTTNPFGRLKIVRKSLPLSMLFGLIYEVLRNPFYFLNPVNAMIYFREYFYFFQRDRLMKWFYPNQKMIGLYEYIEWDENLILSTIKKEINWMQDVESGSSWRFDCKVSFLKNYMLKESLGFTEKDENLSKMIREGLLTRQEAMGRLEKENIVPDKAISEICNEANLSPADLDEAIAKLKPIG